jgi:predicted nucleotidyltransferase
MSIQLDPRHLVSVRDILAHHVPGARAWCYGSRATGTAREFSDLDLALQLTGGVPWSTMEELRWAFSESDLPIRVDIVDWDTLDPEFRAAIEKRRVPL